MSFKISSQISTPYSTQTRTTNPADGLLGLPIDKSIGSASQNDILQYDGTKWIAASGYTGATTEWIDFKNSVTVTGATSGSIDLILDAGETSAYYMVEGKRCHIQYQLLWESGGINSITGEVRISLPVSSSTLIKGGSLTIGSIDSINFSQQIGALVNDGSTYFVLTSSSSGAVSSNIQGSAVIIEDATLNVSGSYAID